jgi:hypothetical protein
MDFTFFLGTNNTTTAVTWEGNLGKATRAMTSRLVVGENSHGRGTLQMGREHKIHFLYLKKLR